MSSRYDRDSSRERDRYERYDRRGSDLACKVYIGELPTHVDEEDLKDVFSYYGPLKSVWVARSPPGFAFIEFKESRDAEKAVKGHDGRTLNSSFPESRLKVQHSTGEVRSKQYTRRGGGQSNSRRAFHPDDRCYECNERGHYAYDCRKRRGTRDRGRHADSRERRGDSRDRRDSSREKRDSSRERRSHSRNRSRSYSRSPRRSKRSRSNRSNSDDRD